jgi:hypothetical protein
MSQQNDSYSNREIDLLMKEIHEKLDAIIAQTTKTNGSVAKCQLEIADLSVWRGYITGGLAILSIIVVPIGIYLITQ